MKKMQWTDPETEEVLVNSESVLGESGDNVGDGSGVDNGFDIEDPLEDNA